MPYARKLTLRFRLSSSAPLGVNLMNTLVVMLILFPITDKEISSC